MKAPTILKNFLLRPRALAAVVPFPETTRFAQEILEELDVLGGEIGLVQLLDAAITTQKIALDSLVNISYRDDSDRVDVDKYLEENVEILDVCNYFVEKIENINNYVDTLEIVVHLVNNNNDSVKPTKIARKRVLELSDSSSCKIVENISCKALKKLLRKRLCHHETEMSEIMCGSKSMVLMCLRFLEHGLSFDSKSGIFPKVKVLSQPTSSSWFRLLHESGRLSEASVEEKKLQKNRPSLLQQTVDAARELKEQIKGEKEIKSCVERLKRSCKEMEDMIEVVEERCISNNQFSKTIVISLIRIINTFIQHVTMAYVDEDDSSGTGEDLNMLDGHKRHPVNAVPSGSGGRKRSRKATGDAIVDAMLEIASASKMRASAILKNEDRFSISKCIKVLDGLQGVDEQVYFHALDLFENNSSAREIFVSLKSDKRLPWLQGKCGVLPFR
ncbi:hypothetical protein P8452_08761 [Trifolium repens]|nr:hypothetical protein P8452_08761 [Trifolium repens]